MHFKTSALLVTLSACNFALSAWVDPEFPLNTAAGWKANGFATGLTRPRGVTFDSAGNLLVVDVGVGIVAFKLNKDGSAASNHTILADLKINHGIALNAHGNVLFASSNETAWKWSYNPHTLTVSNKQTLVYGMGNATHPTRTLLVSKKFPNHIVVARGSNGNIDPEAAEMETGSSQVRVFDLTRVPKDGHAWIDGRTLAWGTRNEVGLDEDQAGNVWGVENSADNVFRRGIDVHQTNPAEKVHSFGPALGKPGTYYGYPYCFSVWDPAAFPEDNFKPGDWFVQQPNDTINDAFCNANAVKPTLLIPPHSAPLDMTFGQGHDSNLYVGFHGSWNRQPPTGYKVVTFAGKIGRNGAWSPNASSTSTTGFEDLLFNTDENACPNSCFRPVGLAWNKQGSILYVTSDATGEVFAVRRA